MNDIFEKADAGVIYLGQVGLDIIIKVNLYIGILRFIRISSGRAIVPVLAVGLDNSLIIRKLCSINNPYTSGPN